MIKDVGFLHHVGHGYIADQLPKTPEEQAELATKNITFLLNNKRKYINCETTIDKKYFFDIDEVNNDYIKIHMNINQFSEQYRKSFEERIEETSYRIYNYKIYYPNKIFKEKPTEIISFWGNLNLSIILYSDQVKAKINTISIPMPIKLPANFNKNSIEVTYDYNTYSFKIPNDIKNKGRETILDLKIPKKGGGQSRKKKRTRSLRLRCTCKKMHVLKSRKTRRR